MNTAPATSPAAEIPNNLTVTQHAEVHLEPPPGATGTGHVAIGHHRPRRPARRTEEPGGGPDPPGRKHDTRRGTAPAHNSAIRPAQFFRRHRSAPPGATFPRTAIPRA
ncbi:hypothetical protein GCM10022403_010730 [Streptomyces coacervatus]|uniref:Uncharacterized protein n=1 Tax=Streptomyces coacervatus TaxID=647381 RepID=A0ABP7H277_9ACTN